MRDRDVGRIVVALAVGGLFAGCRTLAVIEESEPVVITARAPAPPPAPTPPPPPPTVQLEASRIRVDEKIMFEVDSAQIDPRSNRLLDQIAAIITQHPEVGNIRVEGHTDRQGGADYNRGLSQRRAQAVVAYLVSKGVPAERLRAQGFGFDRPLGSNDTEEGRSQNRRVEFNFINAPAEGGANAGGAQ